VSYQLLLFAVPVSMAWADADELLTPTDVTDAA